jgi:hypothetical protein
MSAVTLRQPKRCDLHVFGLAACAEVLDEALTAKAECSGRWMGDRDD